MHENDLRQDEDIYLQILKFQLIEIVGQHGSIFLPIRTQIGITTNLASQVVHTLSMSWKIKDSSRIGNDQRIFVQFGKNMVFLINSFHFIGRHGCFWCVLLRYNLKIQLKWDFFVKNMETPTFIPLASWEFPMDLIKFKLSFNTQEMELANWYV